MTSVFEQAQRFTEMWTELALKAASAGASFDPQSSPPDMVRQTRNATFAALSQQAEQFMRSPQFGEMTKQFLDAAITSRQQFNDALTALHHQVQSVARQDIDGVMLAIRHMETRLLDRLEELERRLGSLEGGKAPRKTTTRRAHSPVPRRKATSKSEAAKRDEVSGVDQSGVSDAKQ